MYPYVPTQTTRCHSCHTAGSVEFKTLAVRLDKHSKPNQQVWCQHKLQSGPNVCPIQYRALLHEALYRHRRTSNQYLKYSGRVLSPRLNPRNVLCGVAYTMNMVAAIRCADVATVESRRQFFAYSVVGGKSRRTRMTDKKPSLNLTTGRSRKLKLLHFERCPWAKQLGRHLQHKLFSLAL